MILIRRSKEKSFIIFSDSVSSLEVLSGFNLELHVVCGIIKDYTHPTNSSKIIVVLDT